MLYLIMSEGDPDFDQLVRATPSEARRAEAAGFTVLPIDERQATDFDAFASEFLEED